MSEVLRLRGCTWWVPTWEFDQPSVVYEGGKRYSPTLDVVGLMEDIAIDIALAVESGQVRPWQEWLPSDLEEFAWRGWDKNGFAARKDAQHVEVTYLIDPDGKLVWLSQREQRSPF